MPVIDLSYSSESEFLSKLAATPNDWVAANTSYRMLASKPKIAFQSPVTLEGKVCGPNNRLEIACLVGASFMDNSEILTNPYAYDEAKGAAASINLGYIPGFFSVKMPYVTFTGYQLRQGQGTGGPVIKVFPGAGDVTLDRCILDGFGDSQYDWPLEVNDGNFKARGTLIVHNSDRAFAAYLNTKTADFENVTFVRPSKFTKGGPAVKLVNGGNRFVNCLAIGFNDFIENAGSDTIILNSGCSGNIPAGTGNKANLVAADVLVSPLNDFRLKKVDGTVNPATDAGRTPSADNTRAPNGVRQQGTAADMGAWETPSTLVAPTATVTNIAVDGRKVTISGTTTGAPTSGKLSTTVSVTPYNSGVAQGPVDLTFEPGKFSAVLENGMIGRYGLTYNVGNEAYDVAGSNPVGSFEIVGPVVTAMTQELDGQVYRLSGTVTGNPTSGEVLVPAAADGQGASNRVFPFAITNGTFKIDGDEGVLTPGEYAAGIVRFSTAAGTSLPQPGTSAISIKGFSGNPQAPDSEDSGAVKVTSVDVSPSTATVDSGGTVQLTVSVTGENFPAQAVTWEAPNGSVDNANLFKAPTTYQDLTFDVTARSVVDPTKSDFVTITVRAAEQPADPVLLAGVASAQANKATTGIVVKVDTPTPTKTATVTLVSAGGVAIAEGTVVKYAWFDQATPDLFVAPTDKGTATVGAGGVTKLARPNSVNAIGWVVVTNSNGDPSAVHKAFSGPVEAD